MAGQNNQKRDDLDAFFSAADSADPRAMEKAAQNVASASAGDDDSIHDETGPSRNSTAPPPDNSVRKGFSDLGGKFIAIDPDAIPGSTANPDQPFVLIPANIHTFLPWWAWTTIGLGLAMLVAGIVAMPEFSTSRLVSRLGDDDAGAAQAVMRQLVLQGDDRTVNKLYDAASSGRAGIGMRLRAVDTLGLIRTQGADRALLRLELSRDTDDRIREAAIAARRQREAARTRLETP